MIAAISATRKGTMQIGARISHTGRVQSRTHLFRLRICERFKLCPNHTQGSSHSISRHSSINHNLNSRFSNSLVSNISDNRNSMEGLVMLELML